MAHQPPHRQHRSASISIPTATTASGAHSSASRNPIDVFSSPFGHPNPSTSTFRSPAQVVPGHSRSSSMFTSGSRSMSNAIPIPGTSPTAQRPAFVGSVSGASPAASSFEPRVVHGTPSRGLDATSTLPSFSPTTGRAQRRSSVGTAPSMGARRPSQGGRRPSQSLNLSAAPGTSSITSNNEPMTFSRPAYLENSVLRDFLQTDAPPASLIGRPGLSSSHTLPPVPEPPVWQHQVVRRARELSPGSDSDDSSIAEFALVPAEPALVTPAANPVLRLPTRWSDQDRHTSLSVSGNGRELSWHGPAMHGEKEAAAARTNHPIPSACGIYYYEVEILSKTAKAYISVGFSAGDVRLSRLPGWEKKSWGYHGDDGHSFSAEKTGTPYGPIFGSGDIIGCGVDFTQHRAFFTRNGAPLPMVFDGIGHDCELYPSVGLRHADESVRVNFGHEPFKYDIEDHVSQQRESVWRSIQSTPLVLAPHTAVTAGSTEPAQPREVGKPVLRAAALPEIKCAEGLPLKRVLTEVQKPDPKERARETEMLRGPMNELVLSYLMHHGYAETAKALKADFEARESRNHTTEAMDTDGAVPATRTTFDGVGPGMHEPEIQVRTRIVQAVARGDVDTALRETRERHPLVLERNGGLMLIKLRCRKFVEMIIEAADLLKQAQRASDGVGKGVLSRDVDDGVVGAMDVDEDSAPAFTTPMSKGKAVFRNTPRQDYETALTDAIVYGKSLRADFQVDARQEVQDLLTETFCIVAYEDPRDVPGEPTRVAGQEARNALASEINQAILETQGRPARPGLERVYRQASASIVQLGLMGVGAAAFADIHKELLDI